MVKVLCSIFDQGGLVGTPTVVAEPTLRYLQGYTEADVELCLAAVRQWWLGIPRQEKFESAKWEELASRQIHPAVRSGFASELEGVALIFSRISVTCSGYSPLKYSKVSGLAV